MDVLLCTASIWHMATISVDRYCSLRFPIRYRRTRTKFFVVAKIAFVWIVSVGICSPLTVAGFINPRNVYRDGQCAPAVPEFVIYGSIFAFYVPLVLMLVTYALTVKTLTQQALWKRRERRRSAQLEEQHQAAFNALLSRLSTKRSQSVRSHSKPRQSDGDVDLRRGLTVRSRPSIPGGQPDGDYAVNLRPRAMSAAAAVCVGGLDRRTGRMESVEDRGLGVNSGETSPVQEKTLTWHDHPVEANSTSARVRHSLATEQVGLARKNVSKDRRRRHTGTGSGVYDRNHTLTADLDIEGRSTATFRPVDHDDLNDEENNFAPEQTRPSIQSPRPSIAARRHANRQQSFSTKTRRIKRKATRVLGVIFLVFIVLWTPFFVINILSAFCPPCVESIDPSIGTVLVWLGWISSFANPIIYTCFSPAFRSAFRHLLTCHCENRVSRAARRQKEWTKLLRDHRQRSERTLSESSSSHHRTVTESLEQSLHRRRRTVSH